LAAPGIRRAGQDGDADAASHARFRRRAIVRACDEAQIGEAGARFLAGLVGVGGDGDAGQPQRRVAEGGQKVGADVTAFIDPAPGERAAGAQHQHARAIGIGIRLPGADRMPVVPDVVDRGIGQLGAVDAARQPERHARRDAEPLGRHLEAQVDARGVVVAGFPRHVGALQRRIDAPAPAQDRRRRQVDGHRPRQQGHAGDGMGLDGMDAVPQAGPVTRRRHLGIRLLDAPRRRDHPLRCGEIADPDRRGQRRQRQQRQAGAAGAPHPAPAPLRGRRTRHGTAQDVSAARAAHR
jgi:hypothetical protein